MISTIIITYAVLLLLICCTAGKLTKPTNSVTIRQNANQICTTNLIGEFVEHPDDCQLFYLCVESGEAVLATCPSTMLFNPISRLCDSAANVRCRNGTQIVPLPTTPPLPDDIVMDAATYCASLTPQQSNDRIVYVGSSSNCGRYYICYYGQAILQECSNDLHWNSVTGKCDLPERAKCTLLTQSETDNNNNNNNGNGAGVGVGTELIHCPVYGQHLYPHMQRCEFFIYCVKGHATLQQCPFYYYFDVVTKQCQWSRTALCVRDLNLPQKLQKS